MYKRICSCGIDIFYKSKTGYAGAVKNNTKCKKCTSHLFWEVQTTLCICGNKIKCKSKEKYNNVILGNIKCGLCSHIIGTTYIRNCPLCLREIIYSSVSAYKFAIKNNCACRKCFKINRSSFLYVRKCECGKDMRYKTKTSLERSIINNSRCNSCVYNLGLGKIDFSGENNPFYGKHHTE